MYVQPIIKTFYYFSVGRFLRTLFKFVMMSTLLVVFCGFMLSLLDEDLYTSSKAKVGVFIQSNVPKPYLKKWNQGVSLTHRTIENWAAQTIAISVHSYNRAHDYFVTISNDETVQQYLESVKSGWHIFWIWVSEAYVSLSIEVPRYVHSLRQWVSESSTNKS